MRYRVIRTRGTGYGAAFVKTEDPRQLRHFAEAFAYEAGVPALVCEAPEGGLVKALYTVGEDPTERKARVR